MSQDSIAELSVGGMTCSSCTSAVTNALEGIEGVKSVNVSLITERAVVNFSKVEPTLLVTAIEDVGFEAELLSVKQPESKLRKLQVAVEGMTCSSCTAAVTQALENFENVESASVSLATEIATVKYKNSVDDFPLHAKEAIEDAGFDAKIISDVLETDRVGLEPATSEQLHTDDRIRSASTLPLSNLDLKIYGVKEVSTLEFIRSKLAELEGVSSVSVNTYTETMTIEYDQQVTGIRSFVRCVESLNYSALVAATADNTQQLNALQRVKALQRYKKDSIIAFALGVPCIVLLKLRAYLPSFLTAKITHGLWVDDVLGLLMVLPILLFPARGFYSKSFKALKAHAPTMDVLVTTSVTSAFVYSVVALIHAVWANMESHQMYLWDACAMILMFVILGKYLENIARGQTSKALSELISLVPEEALVVAPDLNERGEILDTDMIQVGDIIILRPGEKVGADGIVVDGESYISESIVTGESKLIKKIAGDPIIGGTINGTGSLRFRVTSCGSDTKIAQIVSFIKEAQSSRAPIQRYADMAAAKFVPTIILLSISTFLVWYAASLLLGKERMPQMFQHHSLFFMCLRLGIAVIVVACPCALGLATPTAVMVGTGVGAEHGILVKGGSIFEVAAHASVVLFDKTGTLTTGKMSVVNTTVDSKMWPKIRALESSSEHPAGKAIANYIHPDEAQASAIPGTTATKNTSGDEKLRPQNLKILAGEGIEGLFGDELLFVGRRHEYSARNDIQVTVNNELVGTITLQDSLRSDAPAVIDVLKAQGKMVGIISGDSPRAVNQIAELLCINEELTWSSARPEDKVDVINELQSAGHHVVFVGDGINDTPALVTASVGISLEGATHVAVESADIVLTQSSPIGAVPAALDLCKVTMRRIKTNLFASVIYNILMVPFAMGMLLPFNIMLTPMMASASMACSSVSVVVSSLWLMRWRPRPLEEDFTHHSVRWWTRVIYALKLHLSRTDRPRYTPV